MSRIRILKTAYDPEECINPRLLTQSARILKVTVQGLFTQEAPGWPHVKAAAERLRRIEQSSANAGGLVFLSLCYVALRWLLRLRPARSVE